MPELGRFDSHIGARAELGFEVVRMPRALGKHDYTAGLAVSLTAAERFHDLVYRERMLGNDYHLRDAAHAAVQR